MNKNLSVRNTDQKVQLKNISALRQAFVVAAILIVLGVVGSRVIAEVFLVLPLLVVGGLLFSGLAGWCPMALVLERMPWNKQ